MIKGTDLSHWNDKVDYDKMADAGIRFGCLKLGQGQLPKDTMFDIHRENFVKRQLPWDFYWFCDYRKTGIYNADRAIALADGDFGAGHPVMDLEFLKPWGYPPGSKMRRFALDFFGEMELKSGLLAMMYSNRDVINQIMAGISPEDKEEFLRHELWLATDAPYGNPAPWPKYRLNQYELDTKVTWAQGTVDLNEFNGTEQEFAAFYDAKKILTVEEKIGVIEVEARAKGWELWEV